MGQMGFLISLSGGSQEVFLHLSLESLKGFPVWGRKHSHWMMFALCK